MKIIVGLGNPGEEYRTTRHNVGFMAVDALAKSLGLVWQNNKKLKAEIIKNNEMILVKPLTYMNNSGKAVKAVMQCYKLLPKKFGLLTRQQTDLSDVLTVIHDDLDIGIGKYKISVDSRSAGHQGVQSIINYLRTKNFKRFRIGIHTNITEKISADKFVLEKFDQAELKIVNDIILRAIKEI